jgi:hypothetical protein
MGRLRVMAGERGQTPHRHSTFGSERFVLPTNVSIAAEIQYLLPARGKAASAVENFCKNIDNPS